MCAGPISCIFSGNRIAYGSRHLLCGAPRDGCQGYGRPSTSRRCPVDVVAMSLRWLIRMAYAARHARARQDRRRRPHASCARISCRPADRACTPVNCSAASGHRGPALAAHNRATEYIGTWRFPLGALAARCGTAEGQQFLCEVPLCAGNNRWPLTYAYFLVVIGIDSRRVPAVQYPGNARLSPSLPLRGGDFPVVQVDRHRVRRLSVDKTAENFRTTSASSGTIFIPFFVYPYGRVPW